MPVRNNSRLCRHIRTLQMKALAYRRTCSEEEIHSSEGHRVRLAVAVHHDDWEMPPFEL